MFIPEMLVIQHPASDVAKRFGRELQRVVASTAGAADEPGAFENADVFAEAGERHRERFGDIGNARGAAGEAFEDGASGRVGDGGEDAADGMVACPWKGLMISSGASGMLNHAVKLRGRRLIVNRIVQCS